MRAALKLRCIDVELIKKRRLGQTDLAVKPGQVGVNSATKPENLGLFDYAHLRAPLPDNLKGSEIFAPHQNQSPPESYFLMVCICWLFSNVKLTLTCLVQRRSSDGFVSATGMFKAAFPWAKHSEEQSEKEYLKGLPSTAQDEVAGNVWISEHYGLTGHDSVKVMRLIRISHRACGRVWYCRLDHSFVGFCCNRSRTRGSSQVYLTTTKVQIHCWR